jgi:hypothetical protein
MAPTNDSAPLSARANADKTSGPCPFERYLKILKHRLDADVEVLRNMISTI